MRSERDADPMWTVLREGGAYHVRGDLDCYVARLQATGRSHHARRLLARYAPSAA